MESTESGPGLTQTLTVAELEARRLIEQGRLDGLKTFKERNRLGQFATPPALALDIARHVAERWRGRPDRVAFLDPALGTGSFYAALRQAFPAGAIADGCGVEIDPAFAHAAEALWQGTGLRVIRGDFTHLAPDRPYNLILANPPYVRHHHLPREDKGRLQAVISDRCGIAFTIKRGLATGANAFFILEREQARSRGIPDAFLKPILPGARHLRDGVIEAGPDGHPRLGRSRVVIDCDLPEDVIRDRHPGFWSYLQEGRRLGIPSGYLASRRHPWYAQEQREPAPFLCTYMGRRGTDGPPFRFFWNQSRALAANVYLMLHPKGPLEAALARTPSLGAMVLSWLQGLDAERLMGAGRVYGGGLHKLEPRELAGLPAGEMAALIEPLPPRERREPTS